jgi:chromosome segregation ATPase
MDPHQQYGQGERRWKSPLRILVRSLQKSRDNWKRKHQEVKTEVKRFRNQAQDARKSRNHWKLRARDLREENEALQDELVRLKSNLADQSADVTEKKGCLVC